MAGPCALEPAALMVPLPQAALPPGELLLDVSVPALLVSTGADELVSLLDDDELSPLPPLEPQAASEMEPAAMSAAIEIRRVRPTVQPSLDFLVEGDARSASQPAPDRWMNRR
jgi:hypothetical protein